MDLELALVLSCEGTGCLVQYLEGGEPVQTRFSAAVKDRVRIRRKQLVAVDRSSDPPQLVWRWHRAEVLELRASSAVVGAHGVCVEVPSPGADLALAVGDEVWVAGTAEGDCMLDRVVADAPQHADRLRREAFPMIEAKYARMGD